MYRRPSQQLIKPLSIPPTIASIMAANTDDARRLNSAILGVSKEVLAVLMMKIVQDHPSMRDFVEGHLLVNENQVPRPGTPSDSDNDLEDSDNSDDCDESEASEKKVTAVPDSTTQAGPKRMRTRYSTCSNCKEEFDVSENTRKSCSYHPCMLPLCSLSNIVLSDYRLLRAG